MQMPITKVSLAIAAAGITIASAGLASALPAAASPAPAARLAAITTVIDTNFAGDVTGGSRRFRYISADVPMAAPRSTTASSWAARVSIPAPWD